VRPRMDLAHQTLVVTAPPDPIVLTADATRLTQVLGNVLDNASKFTDPGGRIELDAERGTTPEGDPAVVIRIRDTGIGIEQDHVSSIFELFTQVDTSIARSPSGLGIGLTLVKRLVELHGGTVSVHSAGLGHGSEFALTLPAPSEATLPATVVEAPVPSAARRRRVLIVDDNEDAAEMLSTVLRLGGHEVHAVHDGLAAVDAARSFRPEVILLDIGLPKLNGYEVAKQIRAQQGDHKIAIVALTGWGQDADRRRAADAGCDTHWVKPVDEETLERYLADV
jgi:CheY-like chemotaxis protein